MYKQILIFFQAKDDFLTQADQVIYTGMIDQFFDYQFGALEYRSLRFETEVLDQADFQGNAVINYTDAETPFTRIIEHKHFEGGKGHQTVITREYPENWNQTKEPYYPINDRLNNELYKKYAALSRTMPHVYFGGRLGQYKYLNMDQVIYAALTLAKNEFKKLGSLIKN
ncbi:UDP-galactopyranose mutase [Listeria floridensis FSL S10-1187]|uniref:UDP-galactopyranose mutase n=1 Tax=Listeria floridensis FSL S10-1187 TaxID=1265817 RepID=A0ABN0RDM8_9LIST|nr:UDP-galactopyranose mutase [Listeria floridensis FSL S10-1187]